jgi:hypothetical protein
MAGPDFYKQPEFTLRPWGRIEGRVLWKDLPGAGETISLSLRREKYGYEGMIQSSAETRTDAEGRFVFDKVLPGPAQISRFVGDSVSTGLFRHVEVGAGEPTPVLIGGQGRKVAGRLTGRKSWDGVTLRVYPQAPPFFVSMKLDEKGNVIDDRKPPDTFYERAIRPLFYHNNVKLNADGTFEIPRLLPARYHLSVSVPGREKVAASKSFEIDAETHGVAPPPLDLGEVPVKAPAE